MNFILLQVVHESRKGHLWLLEVLKSEKRKIKEEMEKIVEKKMKMEETTFLPASKVKEGSAIVNYRVTLLIREANKISQYLGKDTVSRSCQRSYKYHMLK